MTKPKQALQWQWSLLCQTMSPVPGRGELAWPSPTFPDSNRLLHPLLNINTLFYVSLVPYLVLYLSFVLSCVVFLYVFFVFLFLFVVSSNSCSQPLLGGSTLCLATNPVVWLVRYLVLHSGSIRWQNNAMGPHNVVKQCPRLQSREI